MALLLPEPTAFPTLALAGLLLDPKIRANQYMTTNAHDLGAILICATSSHLHGCRIICGCA
jgi:hypothetical protein